MMMEKFNRRCASVSQSDRKTAGDWESCDSQRIFASRETLEKLRSFCRPTISSVRHANETSQKTTTLFKITCFGKLVSGNNLYKSCANNKRVIILTIPDSLKTNEMVDWLDVVISRLAAALTTGTKSQQHRGGRRAPRLVLDWHPDHLSG